MHLDDEILTTIILFLLSIVLIGLGAFIEGWLVMIIWNRVVPVVFGYHTITYWQAFGLSWLCGLLFKSSQVSSKKKD